MRRIVTELSNQAKTLAAGLILSCLCCFSSTTAVLASQRVQPSVAPPSNAVIPPYISGYVLLPDEAQSKAEGIEVRLLMCEGFCPSGQVGSQTAGAVSSGQSVITEGGGRFFFNESNLALLNPNTFSKLYLNIALEGYSEVTQEVHTSGTDKGGYLHSSGNVLMLNPGPSDGLDLTHREPIPLSRVEVLRQELAKQYGELSIREYEQGLRDMLNKKSDNAAGHFKKATQTAVGFYDAWMQLGAVQKEAKHLDDALESYRFAAAANPKAGEPLIAMAAVWLDQATMLEASGDGGVAAAKYSNAAAQLQQAVLRAPWSSDAFYYLGSALYKLNQFTEAEGALKTALDKTDPRQDARLMLVNLLLKQKRYQEALAQLDAYLAAVPDSPQKSSVLQLQATIRKGLQP